MSDFILSVSRSELSNVISSQAIKRELYNALPWLQDYCKDKDVIKNNVLDRDTIAIIKYFVEVLDDEGRDIHSFANVKLLNVDNYEVSVKFISPRD